MPLARKPATAECLAWLRVPPQMQVDPGNLKPGQAEALSLSYSVLAKQNDDLTKLQKSLASSPAIQNYMVYVNVYGLGWKVEENGTVTLPGYSGTVDLHYAKPVE